MKRILKFLARLYPPAWRNRYGAEYEALLEDRKPRARDAIDILWGAMKMRMTTWGFAKISLASSLAGVLMATAISFAVTPRYASQDLIWVAGSAPLADSDLGRILVDLRPDILDRDFLISVIQEKNLYPRERTRMPLDTVVDTMRNNITIKRIHSDIPIKFVGHNSFEEANTPGFFVGFVYPDPHLAQQVDNELISRFVKSSLLRGQASVSTGQSQFGKQFRIESEANLPDRPAFPRRNIFALGGLATGLFSSLTLAAILRSRLGSTFADS